MEPKIPSPHKKIVWCQLKPKLIFSLPLWILTDWCWRNFAYQFHSNRIFWVRRLSRWSTHLFAQFVSRHGTNVPQDQRLFHYACGHITTPWPAVNIAFANEYYSRPWRLLNWIYLFQNDPHPTAMFSFISVILTITLCSQTSWW